MRICYYHICEDLRAGSKENAKKITTHRLTLKGERELGLKGDSGPHRPE